jgi:ribose transport system ATP-binding protein
MADSNYLEMKNISKSFGGIQALRDVSFGVKQGEIHALLGENGAGKSTLMKILAGAYRMDEGQIFIGGEEVRIQTPKQGMDQGISVIYQEFALVNDLTVAENIFIDNLSKGKAIINWKRLISDAKKILNDLGFGQIDPQKVITELSVAYQQVIEICKALSRKASILVLDEPTSVLSSNEVDQLFNILLKLKNNNVAIIYISHRMEEIFKICDRITVLKDGEYVTTVNADSIDDKRLVNLMIGRDLKNYFPERESKIGDVVFEAMNINRKNIVKDVSFSVRAGEVFGISGLVGSGRTETVRAIFGEDKKDSGMIKIKGKEIKIRSPKDAVKAGISLLPEDRKKEGVLLELPILHNITISSLKKFYHFFGIINRKKELMFANDLVEKLRIKIGSIYDNTSSLSGGNQQKVAISKLLATDSGVLILDEPTRGVDVGAKIEIYKIINNLIESGYSIVMISSEMPEIIGMCDRVAIMRGGTVVRVLNKEEICEENLIQHAIGVSV